MIAVVGCPPPPTMLPVSSTDICCSVVREDRRRGVPPLILVILSRLSSTLGGRGRVYVNKRDHIAIELFAAVAACQHVNKTIVDLQSVCRWATLQHTRGRRVLLLTTNSVKLQRSAAAAAAAAGTRQRAPAGLMTSRPARYPSPKALRASHGDRERCQSQLPIIDDQRAHHYQTLFCGK